MNKKSDKNWFLWICLTLAAVTFTVFYQVHSFDFVNIDDPVYVSENPNIQTGFTLQTVKWAFTTGYANFWHPLTWLSLMLDWQLFGSNPSGYHLINLAFHIANTLLLFIVFKRMTNALWQSAFIAVLFALHPLHIESVAWISERKDVLSAFFWLLTMAAYLRYIKQPSIARYLLTLLTFSLGLTAKPMLVTLPFVFLLLDYWPFNRINSFQGRVVYRLVLEKIPFIIFSAVFSVIAFSAQKGGGAVMPLDKISLNFRICNALISYVKYIEKMFWPSRLAVFYPHPGPNVSVSYAMISVLLLVAVTILILRFTKKHRYLFTGWFWYIGTLLPVSGLVQVGGHAMADRYTYITLTGLFIIIAWGFPNLLEKWRYKKAALISLSLLVISAMSICTYSQLRCWRNSLTLFQHALDVTENNYIAHFGIAEPLRLQNRLDEAIYHYSEAVRISPDYIDALNVLGGYLYQAGKVDEAIGCYERALKIDPNLAGAHLSLAAAFMTKGRFAETVMEYQKYLKIRPDDPAVLNAIGIALSQQGKNDEAAKYYNKVLQIKPNYALAHYGLGQILEKSGKINEAVTHFDKALQLKPDWVELMNTMAWHMAVNEKTAVYNPERAVKLAQRACELTNYKEPELLDTLSVAYAAAGDFNKAIETSQKALGICQSPESITVKKEIESRLILFKNKKHYVEN